MAGFQHTWVAWNGEETVLRREDGIYLGPGIRGMDAPPPVIHRQPRIGHGDRYTGWRSPDREIFWPLRVETDVTQWPILARAFFRGMHPDRPGVWRLTDPDTGTILEMPARWSEDSEDDPIGRLAGFRSCGVKLIGSPFWLGEPVVRSWSQETYTGSWLLGSGGGGVFRFSSAHAFGNATVSNGGDVEAWPEWTITGPCASWTVGVAGVTISSTRELQAGEIRTIITDAGGIWVRDGDEVDRFADLGVARSAPIPAGSQVRLSIAMTGQGSILASFRPRYLRAL